MLNDLLQLKKIKEGDIRTFEEVFRKFYSPLVYFSTGITGRADISEEIIQDLFYVLWRDKDELHIISSFKGYLYRAVRNRSLQYCEHRKVTNTYSENIIAEKNDTSFIGPQEDLEYKQMEEMITRVIEKMPERRKIIFRMHRFENRKYSEIADLLSLSVKTVEAEITKALKTLRKEIEINTVVL